MQLSPVGISVVVVFTWCRQRCCLVYSALAVDVGVCCATGWGQSNFSGTSVVDCTYTTCGNVTKEPVSFFLTRAWGGRQVREQQGQGPNAGRWFCFDDSSVEPWDIANLERDCFGGKQAADYGNFGETTGPAQARPVSNFLCFKGVLAPQVYLAFLSLQKAVCGADPFVFDSPSIRLAFASKLHLRVSKPLETWHGLGTQRALACGAGVRSAQLGVHAVLRAHRGAGAGVALGPEYLVFVVQEYDRPNSAYMLFYERSEALEPVERLRAAASAAASPGASAWAPPADEAAVSAAEQPSEVHFIKILVALAVLAMLAERPFLCDFVILRLLERT